jgi:filamentous hemagglutinin family protein
MYYSWMGISIACTLTISYTLGWATGTVAQITPDSSLGGESSIITPNVASPQGLIDRLDGGAIRGNNLFHSFQDFNVGDLQRVYFSNPAGIENILGRVTGNRVSEILGTLGVLGNANLFLINPNGIVFGPNARLDVSGSFFASTHNSLVLENGYPFSTENPDVPPLLTVNVPLGLQNGLPPQGTIEHSGNLSAGRDLTLIGNTLNVRGQLRAEGNLTLQAADTLSVRDSAIKPAIASAGGQLLVQGQTIDILALNHPASGFFSGETMRLRSPNAIGGDAHFSSGGNFLLEQINGDRGNLSSLDDPIIRANGDVSFNSYTGPSLHIFAGGSVNIDTLEVTAPDTANFINETVTLSDGITTVAVNGSTQPTVDLRAGTTAVNPTGITGDTTGFSETPNTAGTATSADITINRIIAPGGLVFLTNQDRPNSLPGDITVNNLIATANASGGGDFVIDSRGKITTPNILDVSGFDAPTESFTGEGGDITLLANGDIVMPFPSQIFSYGLGSGDIILKSRSAIIQEAASAESADLSFIESAVRISGQGGNVILEAPAISLSSFVQSNMFGGGQGGKLSITADSLVGNGAIILNYTEGGNTGDVTINANSISLNRSQIGSQTVSSIGGNAGNVEINADTFVATGVNPAVLSETGGTGNAGSIAMNVGTLSLREGAQIRSSTRGAGNAGRIQIVADDIAIDGAVLFSIPNIPEPVPVVSAITGEALPGSSGRGSVIDITTRSLSVTNGAGISASTASEGDAGNIIINASESVSFDGNPGAPLFPSGAFVGTLEGAIGQGGTLTINTPSLSVTNGAQLEALTESGEDAGNIIVNASELVFLSGPGTGLFSNTALGSTGNGGSIFMNSDRVEIQDDAVISVDSQGSGSGGSIGIFANELNLDNRASISAETASTDGGNINLSLPDLLILRRGSRLSTTAGTSGAGGDGGNIAIDTQFIFTVPKENSDITANAFLGRGGNVLLSAKGIFGIEFREQLTPLNDITASSQFGVSGTVTITNPEVDPSSGLIELSSDVVDPADRVVDGCTVAAGNSFTVTGRGGLPEDPTAPSSVFPTQMIWGELHEVSEPSDGANNRSQKPQSLSAEWLTNPVQNPVLLLEATSWRTNDRGEVELVAQSHTLIQGAQKRPSTQADCWRSRYSLQMLSLMTVAYP